MTTITGTPRLPLTNITDANGNQVYATYVSGSGTTSATFVYTVQDGDLSAGIQIASSGALDLNGGSIKDLYNTNKFKNKKIFNILEFLRKTKRLMLKYINF